MHARRWYFSQRLCYSGRADAKDLRHRTEDHNQGKNDGRVPPDARGRMTEELEFTDIDIDELFSCLNYIFTVVHEKNIHLEKRFPTALFSLTLFLIYKKQFTKILDEEEFIIKNTLNLNYEMIKEVMSLFEESRNQFLSKPLDLNE